MKRIGFYAIFSIVALLIGGCASPKTPEITKMVIPPPPSEPRLGYLATYHGESDFKSRSLLDTVIGEETQIRTRDMFKPYGVGARHGKIYVADSIGAVFVIEPEAKKVSLVGDQRVGRVSQPVSIAFDKEGSVYVSDVKQKRIHVYDQNGTWLRAIGNEGEFYRPTGIAINSELGILYVVDTHAHNIKAFDLKGNPLFVFGQRGIGDGEFNYPTNIAIDRRNGNIVVGDTQNFRIQVFDRNGKFLLKFGKIGDKPGMFARPKGVAVDSEGHIYAADAAFQNVQIFDEKGQLMMYFGEGGMGPGAFEMPSGLYFDEEDRLYVVEGLGRSVEVYQYFSDVWKKTHPAEFKKMIEEAR